MADVLIRGIEMPKGCYRGCPCYSYHYCNVLQRDTSDLLGTGKRLDDCPLVPVPPHGDLIDRKALLTDTTDMLHSMMVFGGARVYTSDAIKNAPTIIPAEEGE